MGQELGWSGLNGFHGESSVLKIIAGLGRNTREMSFLQVYRWIFEAQGIEIKVKTAEKLLEEGG